MRWLLLFFLTSLLAPADELVVLLHGLARSAKSMEKMEKTLVKEGYQILNLDYPSRKQPIHELSAFVSKKVTPHAAKATKVHFVTHSMGGIIVRHLQKHHPVKNLGRVVMLSPPNKGSEVIDKIGGNKIVKWVNGPAGGELGTGEKSTPLVLGPVNFELGIITGDRSINLINSSMLPGKDDGKVTVESAKVQGMKAFKVVHATHPFIMKKKKIIADVVTFLKEGRFKK